MFLGDFGLAKVMSGSRIIGTATTRAGTPGFQAPELLKKEYVGTECDIYSMGGLMIELFGEKEIWKGYTYPQIMFSVAVQNVHPSTDYLNEPIANLCSSCFSEYKSRPTASKVLHTILGQFKLLQKE